MKPIENIQTKYTIVYEGQSWANESFEHLTLATKRQLEVAQTKYYEGSRVVKQTIVSQEVPGSTVMPKLKKTA